MHYIGLAYTKIQIYTKCPFRATVPWSQILLYDISGQINRLLPKCNDRNKKPKRPFSLGKLANYTRKLTNFGTFLELKML